MKRFAFAVSMLATGCQVVTPTHPSPKPASGALQRWILVERRYDDLEYWIQDSGDAELFGGATTLVFEPVEVEGDERLRLLLQASRCPHRLRCTGEIPDRQQVGTPVEVALSIDCAARDVHRVEVIPTRPGVQVIAIRGALGELPHLSGFYVRGSAKVSVTFTADSQGAGGIKAILSEAGRDHVPPR